MTLSAGPEESAHLGENLKAHERKWGMAPRQEATGAIRVEVPRADIRATDDRWIRVHDDRQPMDEAVRWLEDATAGRPLPDVVCVIGAGLGFVVDAIASNTESRVLVLEPEPAFVPWFLGRRDWRSLIDKGRLLVLAGPDFDGASSAWRLFGDGRTKPLTLVHPVLGRARIEATRRAGQVIGRALQGARANEEARRRFATPYLINTLRNLPTITRSSSVEALTGLCRGIPVALAAAGPSLNRNIEEMRPWRERLVLIAVDTALKPLLAAGIAPDFVVALDPSDANARHLSDVAVPDSTALVAEGSIAPKSFTPFGDRVFVFRVAEHPPWPWLTRIGIDRGFLRAWGSVATSAFDLAVRVGGDPVVLIGTDLAYTGGQLYCRGTTYEEDWRATAGTDRPVEWVWETVIAQRSVPAPGIGGHDIPTTPYLIAFRDWLLEASRRPGMPRLVNATGAGILSGGGFTLASFSDAPLRDWLEGQPRTTPPSHRHTRTVAPSHRRTVAPLDRFDCHLLSAHMKPHNPSPVTTSPRPTPYMQRPRRERVATTKRIRTKRVTDVERWADHANLDPAWDRRAGAIARFIPAGTRVLDLGAGLESLASHLPDACSYTPADIVKRSEHTVVVDLNAGAFPDGAFDVVVTAGVLEHVHDVRALLARVYEQVPLFIASYCTRTIADPQPRLERGWVNDFSLDELVNLCQSEGWQVVAAERLDEAPAFEQWIIALRGSAAGG